MAITLSMWDLASLHISPLEIGSGKETVDLRGIFKIQSFDNIYKVVKKRIQEENSYPNTYSQKRKDK